MTTTINTSRGNYNFQCSVQDMKISTVQKKYDIIKNKDFDQTETRSIKGYAEFPMPFEIDGIMRKLMASDNKKDDFSYNDFKAAKAELEKMKVDIKEYDLAKGILSFIVKGDRYGQNSDKTYVFTLDIETPEEVKAKKDAEIAEQKAKEDADLDKRYAEEHWIRNFFGVTREKYEQTHERDY